MFIASPLNALFISTIDELRPYHDNANVVIIASPGRSGSSMMTQCMRKYAATQYTILKTHLLPPDHRYKGKIIFIFSNPDKGAESALHRMMTREKFGRLHFQHVETSDLNWWKGIGENAQNQTVDNNLLSYDALGCFEQLKGWLFDRAKPCDSEEAQILAIKYENLWEKPTIDAIKSFLNLKTFKLPPYSPRGYDQDELETNERIFRNTLNVGTPNDPLYSAYDEARVLWQQAPAFQYLKIDPF